MNTITHIQQLATTMLNAARRCQQPGGTGVDAVTFLNMLARLEAYPKAELADACVLDAVNGAKALRNNATQIVNAASEAVNPQALAHAVVDVLRGRQSARSWGEDVLLVTTIEPWLTPAKRQAVRGAMNLCIAAVQTCPVEFNGAATVVAERMATEPAVPAGALRMFTAHQSNFRGPRA